MDDDQAKCDLADEMRMYVFIRAEGFYPVHEPRGDDAIAEHVRLNPGTKEVQCAVTGRVVWKEAVH